jgi:hypothetical protein
MNLITPDNDERFTIELSNATLTNIEGHLADDADLTITVNRTDLETVMAGQAKFDSLIEEGKAKLEGDRQPYETLKSVSRSSLGPKANLWLKIRMRSSIPQSSSTNSKIGQRRPTGMFEICWSP